MLKIQRDLDETKIILVSIDMRFAHTQLTFEFDTFILRTTFFFFLKFTNRVQAP